jgi:hypothetical protein
LTILFSLSGIVLIFQVPVVSHSPIIQQRDVVEKTLNQPATDFQPVEPREGNQWPILVQFS